MAPRAVLVLLAACARVPLAVAVAGCAGLAGQAGICKDVENDAAAAMATELLQVAVQRRAELVQPAAVALAQGEQLPGLGDLMSSVNSAVNSTMKSVMAQGEQLPGLGDLMNSVNSALNSTMKSVSDAVGSITDAAQNTSSISDTFGSIANSVFNGTVSINSLTGGLANSAAAAVASAMNSSLVALGAQADVFTKSCQQMQAQLLTQMNHTKKEFAARAAVLEANATAAVNQALPQWDQLTLLVGASTSTLTAALSSVGLADVGTSFNSSLSSALKQAAAVRASLENVTGLFSNLSGLEEKFVSEHLNSIQDMLQSGLDQVDGFATNLSAAFGDLADQAAEKIVQTIPGADLASIHAAFDKVDAAVAQAFTKVVGGPEALVVGLSDATGMVEDTLPQARSMAHRVGSGILALVALALAAAARL